MSPDPALSAFAGRLRSADSDDREFFATVIQDTRRLLHLDTYTMSNMFNVSLPTIERWEAGRSSPHPIGRRPLYNQILGLIEARPGSSAG